MGFYAEKDWGGTFEQVARIGMQDAIECIKEVCGRLIDRMWIREMMVDVDI
jgi:hypothetical protein